MKKLKERIPDIETLQKSLDKALLKNLSDFVKTTRDQREQVKADFKYLVLSFTFVLAILIFLFFNYYRLGETWYTSLLTAFALQWTFLLLIFGRSLFSHTRLLSREFNMALVPIFNKLFNRSFLYTQHQDKREEIKKGIIASSLITDSEINFQVDDSYQAFVSEVEVAMHEVVVTAQMADSSDSDDKKTVQIFKGLFVETTLPRAHDAETYISTENDRTGFAHRDFWDDTFEMGKVKEFQLESNDFERKFHVASSNEKVAREIITPDLMEDISEWWQEHHLNMRIALKGDKFYMLMPEASIRICTTTTSTKPHVIKRYALTLAKPIWRSLKLIEDVSD